MTNIVAEVLHANMTSSTHIFVAWLNIYKKVLTNKYSIDIIANVLEKAVKKITGCGSAWLERLVWDQEVAGSNPVTPTDGFIRYAGVSELADEQD